MTQTKTHAERATTAAEVADALIDMNAVSAGETGAAVLLLTIALGHALAAIEERQEQLVAAVDRLAAIIDGQGSPGPLMTSPGGWRHVQPSNGDHRIPFVSATPDPVCGQCGQLVEMRP